MDYVPGTSHQKAKDLVPEKRTFGIDEGNYQYEHAPAFGT